MKVSVIIPTFNEERVVRNCLQSLAGQDYPNLEIIVVDDGSTDSTFAEVKETMKVFSRVDIFLIKQDHRGPGAARNLGALKSTGEVLVFVDADMEFESDFISKLVEPIVSGKVIGTFSKEEYLLNTESTLARCWNLNFGRSAGKMSVGDGQESKNWFILRGKRLVTSLEGTTEKMSRSPEEQHVFRAILKSKFLEVGGFDENVGYTDDWSVSRKLNTFAQLAPGAKFYHRNPESLSEVWSQARWFGKNEFLTKSLPRKLFNLARFNPVFSPLKGVIGAIRFFEAVFIPFKVVYDTAVFTSVLFSFFGEKKTK